MRDLYSDDYESVAGEAEPRLIPDRVRGIAGAGVFLVLVGALGLWSWHLGTRDAAEVPIIKAMDGPSRVQPAEPGGATAAHQGLEVNTVLAGEKAPAPRTAVAAAPAPALAEEDAPAAELVSVAPDFSGETGTGTDEGFPPAGTELTADAEDAEPPATSIEALVAQVQAAEPPATVAAGPRPRTRPVNLVRVSAAPAAPAPAKAVASVPEPAKAAAAAPSPSASREVSTVSSGSRMVQLGAYDSEAITRSAWARLVARNGDLLGDKSLYIERATSNARVFYRLRVAGFSSAGDTRVMCEQLRARGIDCIPVTLQ